MCTVTFGVDMVGIVAAAASGRRQVLTMTFGPSIYNVRRECFLSAFVLTYWMTLIALHRAKSNSMWELIKIASLGIAGVEASASWYLGSTVTRIFSVGNMLWVTITVGMLFQAVTQHVCNANLWDDQVISRQALVIFSVGAALLATGRISREQTAC